MKQIKYISFIMIICIIFIAINELFVLHLESFQEEFHYMTFYRPKNSLEVTQSKMKHDIIRAARKHDIKIFVIYQDLENIYSSHIKIYTTENIEKEMVDLAEIKEGSYQSIFLGNIRVSFIDFESIEDIDSFSTFYYIGNKSDAKAFKRELVDVYSGKFPQDGYVSENDNMAIAFIWGIGLSFILLLSVYQIMLEKKEVAIKLIFGESLQHILLKNICSDGLFFGSTWLIIYTIGKNFLNLDYKNDITFLSLVLFLIIDLVINLALLKNNYQYNSQKKKEVEVLKFSYIYKFIIIIICIILATGWIAIIVSGYNCYLQKKFYKTYQKYSYCKIESNNDELVTNLKFDFYKKKLNQGKTFSLNRIESINGKKHFIYADEGTMDYLESVIPELENKNLNEKVVFILPVGKRVEDAIETWDEYYHSSYQYKIIYYRNKVKLISNDSPDYEKINGVVETNPTIILNHLTNPNFKNTSVYLIHNTMYQIDKNEWNKYMNYDLVDKRTSCLTNVYDNYLLNWIKVKRYLILGIGIVGLIFLLQIVITKTILEYEYKINSKEIVLKKILGYSLIKRYQMLILTTVLGDFMGIFMTILIFICLNIDNFQYALIDGIVFVTVDSAIIIKNIHCLESEYINKILKGGIL
ncbi:MAG: hypothetical protein UHS41_03110 [Lachnospiraceae bacterium]|nr:hypothetical protein [Lachnospiraceae bacterium]